jgi:hypothetical protein
MKRILHLRQMLSLARLGASSKAVLDAQLAEPAAYEAGNKEALKTLLVDQAACAQALEQLEMDGWNSMKRWRRCRRSGHALPRVPEAQVHGPAHRPSTVDAPFTALIRISQAIPVAQP